MRGLVLLGSLLVLSLAGTAQAQTAVNPCCVHFTPSPDHFSQTYDSGGQLVNVVTRYDFTGTAMNSIGAIALTKDMGKPAPGPAGTIDVDLSSTFATMVGGTTYTAVVTAIGPGGAGASTPSNPFARGGNVPPPGAPTNVVVNKIP